MEFATVFIVMAEPDLLGQALCKHYPLPGMTPRSVIDDGMDRFVVIGGALVVAFGFRPHAGFVGGHGVSRMIRISRLLQFGDIRE